MAPATGKHKPSHQTKLTNSLTLSTAPRPDKKARPIPSTTQPKLKYVPRPYVDKKNQPDPNDFNDSGGEDVASSNEGSDSDGQGPALAVVSSPVRRAMHLDEDEDEEEDEEEVQVQEQQGTSDSDIVVSPVKKSSSSKDASRGGPVASTSRVKLPPRNARASTFECVEIPARRSTTPLSQPPPKKAKPTTSNLSKLSPPRPTSSTKPTSSSRRRPVIIDSADEDHSVEERSDGGLLDDEAEESEGDYGSDASSVIQARVSSAQKKKDDRKKAMEALSSGRKQRQDDNKKGKKVVVIRGSSEEDSEEDEPPRKSRPATNGTKRRRSSRSDSSASPVPVPPSRKRKIATASQKRDRRSKSEDDTEGSPDSDDDGFIVRETSLLGKKDRKGKGKAKEPVKKKKKLVRKKIVSEESGTNEEDEDDLELSGKETVLPDDQRLRAAPTGKVDKYEAFRRLREGRKAGAAPPPPTTSQSRPRIVEPDSEDEVTIVDPKSKGKKKAPVPVPVPVKKFKPALKRTYLGAESSSEEDKSEGEDDEDEDDSDASSIQEDEDGNIQGWIAPEDADDEARAQVEAYRDKVNVRREGLMYFLKSYIQLLVHAIVCPQVDWLDSVQGDQTFIDAEKKIDSTLKGMLSSLIGSSAWRTNFKHALDSRPEFALEDLDAGELHAACDACKMGQSRHSTLLARVWGEKYDPKTLRPLRLQNGKIKGKENRRRKSRDSDSESGESSSSAGVSDIENKDYSFNVGSSCAHRARIYHALVHWRYSTRQRVLQKLDSHKIRKVFPRTDTKGLSVKDAKRKMRDVVERNRGEAERCSQELDKAGIVAMFAKELEQEINVAREAFAVGK